MRPLQKFKTIRHLSLIFLMMSGLENLTQGIVMAATVDELKGMLQPRSRSTAGRKKDLQDRAKDCTTASAQVGDATTPVTNGSGDHLDNPHGH